MTKGLFAKAAGGKVTYPDDFAERVDALSLFGARQIRQAFNIFQLGTQFINPEILNDVIADSVFV